MKRLILGLIAIAASAPAMALPPPPPPPIAVSPSANSNERQLLMWHPGEVRCSDGAATDASLRRPLNQLVWERSQQAMPLTYGFAIDRHGRTHSIAKVGETIARYAEDVAPALAASRFEAGRSRTGCTVTFSPGLSSMEDALLPELISYSLNGRSRDLPREGWDRIGDGRNCGERPVPAPLLRAYPDFGQLPATPGARDWSMIGYDLDAQGRPVNERVVTGTGNIALDRAAVEAVAESRFNEGARKGCLYPYWLAPKVLAAPQMPSNETLTPADAACEAKDGFTEPPKLIYPEPYRKRSIEGWAIVSYDVAPWGEIGNVKVLEAQPSEDFGAQAVRMLQAAKARTSGTGMVGCVDRVRFEMNVAHAAPEEPNTIILKH